MGYKVSDGKAFDATTPDTTEIKDYDLYRIGGWNGVAIGSFPSTTDVGTTMAFECDPAAIYSILLPTGIDPDAGDFLYWDTNDSTTFQAGEDDLVEVADAADGQQPCFHVLVTKNDAGYAQGRVMQSTVTPDATDTPPGP